MKEVLLHSLLRGSSVLQECAGREQLLSPDFTVIKGVQDVCPFSCSEWFFNDFVLLRALVGGFFGCEEFSLKEVDR